MIIVEFTKDPLADLPPDDPRSPGYAYRLLNRSPRQEPQSKPEPEPAEGTITVAHHGLGVRHHIDAADWPSYQAEGYRVVPNPGVNPPIDPATGIPARHVDDVQPT